MVKDIHAFDIMVNTAWRKAKYQVFAIGQWDDHIMDWAGCNFRRILVKAPTRFFNTYAEAEAWKEKIEAEQSRMRKEKKNGELVVEDVTIGYYYPYREGSGGSFRIHGTGTHCPDFDDIRDERTVDHELTQEEFEYIKQEVKDLKGDRKSQ